MGRGTVGTVVGGGSPGRVANVADVGRVGAIRRRSRRVRRVDYLCGASVGECVDAGAKQVVRMSTQSRSYDVKTRIKDALASSTSDSLKQMRQARTELVLGVYSGMDGMDMLEQRKRLQAWVIASYMNLLPFRNSINQWQDYSLWVDENGNEVGVDYIEDMFTQRDAVKEDSNSRASNPETVEVPKIYPWEHLVAASKTLDDLAGEAIMNRRPAFHADDKDEHPEKSH